jgi:hypothetical protein
MPSNRCADLNRGHPGGSPALVRRKKLANARFRRRSVACWDENDHVATSGRSFLISLS